MNLPVCPSVGHDLSYSSFFPFSPFLFSPSHSFCPSPLRRFLFFLLSRLSSSSLSSSFFSFPPIPYFPPSSFITSFLLSLSVLLFPFLPLFLYPFPFLPSFFHLIFTFPLSLLSPSPLLSFSFPSPLFPFLFLFPFSLPFPLSLYRKVRCYPCIRSSASVTRHDVWVSLRLLCALVHDSRGLA